MFKSIRKVTSIAFLGAALASVACSSGDGIETDAEHVAEWEQAIGEAGCGTMACTSVNSCAPAELSNTCAGSQPNLKIATPPYGSVTCPSQFVVADTTPPTRGGSIRPSFAWVGAPLTAANCTSAVVEVTLYAKSGMMSAPQAKGTQRYRGEWSGSSCVLTSHDPLVSVPVSADLKEVRSAGSAKLGPTQQPVKVGYWHMCG